MFGHINHRAAEFPPKCQALDHAHHDKAYGSDEAGSLVRGQHADQERRTAHQHDGDQKRVLASHQVAQPAKDNGAERTKHESRREP
ncbi:hypothetical protein D3C72_2443260 [compost metagenome]